ncbi:MAG: hypothetical protein DWQ08_14980 [Proteobacteria bacterium]|nr:MAG: hypothetical protein DWQ08_14980 [Pseudomonadota bacterium]
MLSNHVAESLRNLESYDFAGTGIYMMQVDGSIKAATINLLGEIQGDDRMRFGQLSRNAHTLRAYKSLPHGWRTTPEEEGTDCHMWNQFMSEPDIRANVLATPTILYFKQMERRHWPIEKRCAELEDWFNRLNSDGGELKIHREGARTLYTENYHLKRQVNALSKALRRPLNIRGKSPAEAVRLLAVKAFNRRRPG